ncbi:aminotransferase class III-fold pyridoxal phosphate-dependent enzyme, partial [bacterium]|nr:aminotransferase class III-fold pyridoxal phosphate-dependent enzyme [bacterium]
MQFFDIRQDPRIKQAKQLIFDAIHDRKSALDGVRPPDPNLAELAEADITRLGDLRGGALVYPYISSGIGNGALVRLSDGSVKYDFINGIGAHFGHSLDALTDAMIDAALSDTVMQGNLQQDMSALKMMELLTAQSGLPCCFLSTSGAMAAENALKLAFHRHSPRKRVLAFERCFMGRTLALASVTDKAAYRNGLPSTIQVDYVPFFDEKDPAGSTSRAVNALKSYLHRYPDDYAAMVFELVQGEGGYYTAPAEFFIALMDILKTEKIAVIIDEIQTFGRLSRLFAFQHFELDRYVDIVTVGKITQVCATLFRDDYKPKPGLISQTFTGATSSILAGIRIVETLVNGDYWGADGRNMKLHAYFVNELLRLNAEFQGRIEGPYGLGMMIGFTPVGGEVGR